LARRPVSGAAETNTVSVARQRGKYDALHAAARQSLSAAPGNMTRVKGLPDTNKISLVLFLKIIEKRLKIKNVTLKVYKINTTRTSPDRWIKR
jgi:hypothetical protein